MPRHRSSGWVARPARRQSGDASPRQAAAWLCRETSPSRTAHNASAVRLGMFSRSSMVRTWALIVSSAKSNRRAMRRLLRPWASNSSVLPPILAQPGRRGAGGFHQRCPQCRADLLQALLGRGVDLGQGQRVQQHGRIDGLVFRMVVNRVHAQASPVKLRHTNANQPVFARSALPCLGQCRIHGCGIAADDWAFAGADWRIIETIFVDQHHLAGDVSLDIIQQSLAISHRHPGCGAGFQKLGQPDR